MGLANGKYEIVSIGIAQGSTVTSVFDVQPNAVVGIVGTLTMSVALAMRGSLSTTSADFARVYKTDATTHYIISPLSGVAFAAPLYDSLPPFPFWRIEFLAAANSINTFGVVIKR